VLVVRRRVALGGDIRCVQPPILPEHLLTRRNQPVSALLDRGLRCRHPLHLGLGRYVPKDVNMMS
jgi:hypothetical protein